MPSCDDAMLVDAFLWWCNVGWCLPVKTQCWLMLSYEDNEDTMFVDASCDDTMLVDAFLWWRNTSWCLSVMMQCYLLPSCDDTKCFFTICNPWFYVLCVSWVNRVLFNSLLLSSHFCIKQWNILWLWKLFCRWNKANWWLSLPPVCLCRIWVKLRNFRNFCTARTRCCCRCWSQGSQCTLAITGLKTADKVHRSECLGLLSAPLSVSPCNLKLIQSKMCVVELHIVIMAMNEEEHKKPGKLVS